MAATPETRDAARLQITKAFERYTAETEKASKMQRQLDFCYRYNQGADADLGLEPWVRGIVGEISRSGVLRWQFKLKKEGPDFRENYRGRISAIEQSRALAEACEECLAAGGKHWGPKQIRRVLLAYYDFPLDQIPSAKSIQRWRQRWIADNPQRWMKYCDPERARGAVVPAFGSRSQGIERPNQLWELDSSPTDLLLRHDGGIKRYTLLGCIDVCTRRAKVLVAETSNGKAILQLLRNAILDWGMPESLKTDNGKDYISVRVSAALYRLGIRFADLRCNPGQPMEKPHIERFFRTLQHHDLTVLPGFVGHNVADRQALRSKSGWQQNCIELAMSPEQLHEWLQKWANNYDSREHSALGHSPIERLTAAIGQGWQPTMVENPRHLDALMLASVDRTVNREGIRLNNRWYVAPELAGLIRKGVHVCYDDDAPEQIYCYRDETLRDFICAATWREACDLAAVAAQTKESTKIINLGTRKITKGARTLQRKIAKNPERLLGNGAEVVPLTPAVKSFEAGVEEAIQAIKAAIAPAQPETHQFDEAEQAKFERWAAEAEAKAAKPKQPELTIYKIFEICFDNWAADQESAPELLEKCCRGIETNGGALSAVCGSKTKEKQFIQFVREFVAQRRQAM
nr:Mu transposase C-terminal domain-containing protein [Petrachloros mirabilis]